ncbi:hypothetical protein [Celeribacter sp.]|uniref:hypothetical protein n=1 Tax=Celeribacter sp. TaxID=1890673 RepID=UPI003A91C661
MSNLDHLIATATSHPIVPWLGWIVLGVIAVWATLNQIQKTIPEDPIDRLKETFGAPTLPHVIALGAVVLWLTLALVLSVGLITLLIEIVWNTVQPEGREAKGDFRFLLTKTTALTAVLGALIALPFTMLKLKHTAAQTRHAANVLFNEKLNDATADLYARYQKSETKDDQHVDVWHDDIIRRNGAIDRLGALVADEPRMAPRVARILSIYLKEMSDAHPAEEDPGSITMGTAPGTVFHAVHKRSDMRSAFLELSRIRRDAAAYLKNAPIDLSHINLQCAHSSNLNLSGVDLSFSRLDSSFIRAADFQSTYLLGVTLNGALLLNVKLNKKTNLAVESAVGLALNSTDLSSCGDVSKLIENAFGDKSVILPSGVEKPNWPDAELDTDEFMEEWDLFKQDPDAYVPPQLRGDGS